VKANGNIKGEIAKRTRDTSKLIELEAQKLAVGEMVVERLDTILDLLRAAGFKAKLSDTIPPRGQSTAPPPNTIIMQAPPAAQPAPVKNPCVMCGQEAAFAEDLPDGSKKFYCRPHAQERSKAKQEEAQTSALFGNTGTMFTRPAPKGPPPTKTIIQADPDPLKGPFPPNGGTTGPPHNSVLDDD